MFFFYALGAMSDLALLAIAPMKREKGRGRHTLGSSPSCDNLHSVSIRDKPDLRVQTAAVDSDNARQIVDHTIFFRRSLM